MLAHSRIFDTTGRVKLTNENRDLRIRFRFEENPLHEVVDQINEIVEEKTMAVLRVVCENEKLSFAKAKSNEKCIYAARLLTCYAKECELTQKGIDMMETAEKMMAKMKKRIVMILRSSKTSLLQEKMQIRAKLEKELAVVQANLADFEQKIEACEKELKRQPLTAFLQRCYDTMDKYASTASLYMALPSRDKETVKRMIQKEAAQFETMERLHGVRYQKRKEESLLKSVTHQLQVNKYAMEALHGELDAEVDKEERAEEAAAVVAPVEVPDNWDDDL